MADVRSTWEQRALESGTQLSGVLFRGLSQPANSAIHAWHSWVVRSVFAPRIPDSARVLDLGCGYGRISRVLLDARPDVCLTGQDVALGYCRLYQTDGTPCVCADAARLPYAASSFDAVLAVTCLMYAPRTHVSDVLLGLYQLIRPGGVLLLLDPGLELQRVVALVRGKRSHSPTGGEGFMRDEYVRRVEECGFDVVARGGNPWLSTLLLLTGGGGHAGQGVAGNLLDKCLHRDCLASGYSRLALHRWVLAAKQKQADVGF